jgi:hypothetical protein
MPPQITTLISSRDNSEVIRDKLAEILLTEQTEQQVLAAAADPPQDPDQWKLRVFTERSNPWEEWVHEDAPGAEEADFQAPIVNIFLQDITYDTRSSNVVSRQKAIATYNIDCYGYGVSSDAGSGHDPGDARSSLEAQRAVRLVRQILMAGHYTYLGLPHGKGENQFVWKRWLQSVTMFQPALEGRPVQHVSAARLSFQVEFNEFSPQVEGEELEAVEVTVTRRPNGEVYLVAEVGTE